MAESISNSTNEPTLDVRDDRLWCMHVSGMDEVHPAPDRATAQRWAAQFTIHFLQRTPVPHPYEPVMNFTVQEWPHTAEAHAQGLWKSVSDNTWWEDPLAALNGVSFQNRVQPWLIACFGEIIAGDREERNHRFLEEALELVQACGCTASEAHQLVDYVYGRPIGEPHQEAGGVMVTLAALCLANKLDMHADGEAELTRIWTKVEAIRAKQAAKPKNSPLPEHTPASDGDKAIRFPTYLEPDAADVALLLNGTLSGCAHCGGTPTTFARYFGHSGIFQQHVSCSRCHASVLVNDRDREEARRLAIAAWDRRPAAVAGVPAGEVEREIAATALYERWADREFGSVRDLILAALSHGEADRG